MQISRLCIQVWNSSSRRQGYSASTRNVSIQNSFWSERRANNKQRWHYIYTFCRFTFIVKKRYKRGFLQRHSVTRDWLNGCLLYVALIYNTSQSLFLIVSFLFLFCFSYKFIRIKNTKIKKLRAIFIYKKYFCNYLVVDSLVATFLAKLFFQGIFFSWNL